MADLKIKCSDCGKEHEYKLTITLEDTFENGERKSMVKKYEVELVK